MKLTELDPGDSGLAAARPGPDLAAAGWLESEYVASGTATSYAAQSMPTDGELVLRPSLSADYATRVAVRRPSGDWSGTLVVEWLNVSSGNDVAPDWTYLADELVRRGHAWVGVSAQYIGVEGGRGAVPVPGGRSAGLRGKARYAELHHPGDAYSYDMFTQVGEHLRDVLGATCVLAIGESQSACMLTTYLNGVQPLAGLFDGFLVHSRGGAAAPVGVPGSGLKIAEILTGAPTRIRADLEVPVIVVQTETDLFGHLAFLPARQPDSDRLRIWEVAGTAHADSYQIGEFESFLGCTRPVNRGQQVYVLRAALRHLESWACGGPPAPVAQPLVTVDDDFVRDTDGNACGGVRTPVVDVPVEQLSGLPVAGSTELCRLFGSTETLADERLAELYPLRSDYEAAYAAAADSAIAAGFMLADDRPAILEEAGARADSVLPTG